MSNDNFQTMTYNNITINVGDIVFYTRIIPNCGVCYTGTYKIRTIYEDIIMGINLVTKETLPMAVKDFGVRVFIDKHEADKIVKRAKKKIREVV